MIRLRSSRGRV